MKIRKPRRLGFFTLLLTLLGIGSCSEVNNEDDPFKGMLMYGTPTAHYSLKGKVVDEKGNPIPNIDISLYGIYQGSPGTPYGSDPFGVLLKTDDKGTYVYDSQHFPYPQVRVQFDDSDGPANGGDFESNSTLVDIKFEKSKQDKNPWYSGSAKVDVPTVKLKKK